MAFRSEAQEWEAERRKVARRQSARGRAFAIWFAPMPSPQPDHFVWRDVAETYPVELFDE